ncbi:MAG: hypothetical protein CSA81_13845 [Acidobacteria bacterium]|nr:MAG: hypothetical protein CSA81_13845 [Acidobacteriota bacterium]
MNPQPDITPRFTLKAGNFENEKTIQEALRNPDDNKDSLQVVTIRPGLHIVTLQTNPEIIPCYKFDIEHAPVGFFFSLSGKIENVLERGQGKQPASIVNQRGINSVSCLDGARGYSHYLSDEIAEAVMVYIDSKMLTCLIAEELDGISLESRELLQQKNSFFSLPMTGEMYNVATRALYHPYHGTAARLHLEGCGLELLALQIDRFSRDMHREKPLCRADEERIRMAADILVRQMKSPPTISALAMQVGMSSTKLKKGFKQIFGTTIGQFLLQHRMNHARELIINRQVDVTQAAFSVGYSNVSHFIHYYKKMFGVTPGRDKQRRGSYGYPPA